ncbi:DUF1842 domain-containing protein [Pseudoalteromonas sp. MMG024]|uniref:DUF1842 domain-containing protein n=1 Tax=Pseudoalteromonas sp. MMG024 TaxID=2909980 RepID=UPI001F2026F8|nr:DUF1842 domain-containing protein [Pseudoalteromonas sp. MMG024]MCF6458359.1 DUF1842 domain-containing protein [Pseudoalteromonas sp. MMG024]
MADSSLYLVKLQFKPDALGAGSMVLQLAVNPSTGTINGAAEGHILEGTQHSPSFTGSGSGHLHATGLGTSTKVAALTGNAVVSFPPPAIGSYQTNFTASLSVDDNWNGTGSFSVGDNTYACQVSMID